MMYYDPNIQAALDENLEDWCDGGPHDEGWTRDGLSVPYIPLKIRSFRFGKVAVEEVLAKNKQEVERWHLQFLTCYTYGNWEKTSYFQEYLLPRLEEDEAYSRAVDFTGLLNDVIANGVRRAVWVADVSEFSWLPFHYFRFDGCHRACCAKFCGIKTIPALIFTVDTIH